jgi:hypothetical protein
MVGVMTAFADRVARRIPASRQLIGALIPALIPGKNWAAMFASVLIAGQIIEVCPNGFARCFMPLVCTARQRCSSTA